MGLGKSLSTIALIASDKDPKFAKLDTPALADNPTNATLLIVRAPRKRSVTLLAPGVYSLTLPMSSAWDLGEPARDVRISVEWSELADRL